MKRVGLILAVLASPASGGGYDGNPVLASFRDNSCGRTIDIIENAAPAEPVGGVLGMASLFGFLLGFDTAHGGLEADNPTTLTRLKSACEQNPELSALDILRSFATDTEKSKPTSDHN